jgi:ABC-2 type transport system permease protein
MAGGRQYRRGLVGIVDEGRVMRGSPGMVWFLARHEWRVLSASAIARLVLAVFGAALLVAAGIGVTRAGHERQTVSTFEQRGGLQRPERRSLSADVTANQRGWLALLPPAPLSALAVGQGDVYPNYIKVTARSLDALVTGDQIEHPLAVASGQFDTAFVVLFLYPLLIFAISFDLTASERDRGTLRMVLAQPVTLRSVVMGKMIVRAAMLLVPMLLIPIALLALTTPTGGDFWSRAALWTAAVTAYGAIWHGLALAVNARGLSAPANALVLAGIWLGFAVVGPSCVNLLIAMTYPMPSRVDAAIEARAATQEATVQGSQQLGQFLQDHPTSANVGREGMRQFALLQAQRDERVAARLQAVETSFNDQLRRQQRLASWLSVLSPTMIAQGVLLDVAGTSSFRYEHFRAETAAFQQQWRAYFEPRVLDAATLTPEEYAAAPTFSYVDEPTAAMVQRVALPILAIGIAAGLLWWLGLRRYQEYQV